MCSPWAARRGTGVKRTQGIDGHAAQSAVKAATARRARQESARSKKPSEHAPRVHDRVQSLPEPVCWAEAEATNTQVHVEMPYLSEHSTGPSCDHVHRNILNVVSEPWDCGARKLPPFIRQQAKRPMYVSICHTACLRACVLRR
jgi:hypothetical protein